MSDFKPTNPIELYDVSGNKAIITSGVGLRIAEVGQSITTGEFVLATSGSGGVALTTSGGTAPYGIKLKNMGVAMAGISGRVYIGSSGSPPNASGGYALHFAFDEVDLKVTQPDLVRVYGMLSGCVVTWMKVDY